MSILLKCGCGKQLQVRDDLAGKKARCPGCGTILAVPMPSQKVVVPEVKRHSPEISVRRREEDDEESERITRRRPMPAVKQAASDQDTDDDSVESSPLERDDPDRDERRRRHKKKKKRSVLFKPLITMFGINLTPLALIIMAAVFCMAGVSAFFYFTAPEARVKVVDVYNLDDDLGEFSSGGFDVDFVMKALFRKEIPRTFVVRESRDGGFLMVNFKISERTLKKLLGNDKDYTNFVMKKKDVVLQGDDGDPIYPLFLFEREYNAKDYVVKKKARIDDDDEGKHGRVDAGEVFEAKKKPVSPSEENPWTHEGILQIDPAAGKSTFKGIHGMKVTFDHGPLPSKEIKVTWDDQSFFRFGVKEEEVASEIWLYDWRITCLFPRPASTKNLKLTVLGKAMKMDYP